MEKELTKDEMMQNLVQCYSQPNKYRGLKSTIPQDFQSFHCIGGVFMNVFMLKETPLQEIEQTIVLNPDLQNLIRKAISLTSKAIKSNSDTLIFHPIPLNGLPDNFVGLLFTNINLMGSDTSTWIKTPTF